MCKLRNNPIRSLLVLLACVSMLGVPADAANKKKNARFTEPWVRSLPVDLYKDLSMVQRASIDKLLAMEDRAAKQKNKKQEDAYLAVAAEWEKFRVQHGMKIDPDVFAYSLLMQARMQHAGKSVFTAIKTYTEVLDLYPESVWVAAPALYFRGKAHFTNGNERKGLADSKALVEHEKYSKHPLTGNAMAKLAENYWSNDKFEQSMGMWQRIVDEFGKTNPGAKRTADERIYEWTLMQGSIPKAYEATLARTRGKGTKKEVAAVKSLYGKARSGLNRGYREKYYDRAFSKKEADAKVKKMKEDYWEWYLSNEGLFAEAGELWTFYMTLFNEVKGDAKPREVMLTRISTYLRKGEMEETVRTKRAIELMKILRGLGRKDEALSLLEFVPDQVQRLWLLFDFAQEDDTDGSFKEALGVLDQLDALKDDEVAQDVLVAKAALYHKKIKDYKEAISLYHQIADPPDTLWSIVECYRAWGKRDEAQMTLSEIASIFPDQAARAMLAKGDYFRKDGEKQRAIGMYRQITNHPQWQKTEQSRAAHNHLEKWDIQTGGARVHEAN